MKLTVGALMLELEVLCDSFDRVNEPVTIGVPLPRGLCADERLLSLADGNGAPVPLQVTVLDRWVDRSIRWALLDFQATCRAGRSSYRLALEHQGEAMPAPRAALQVQSAGDELTVSAGSTSFTVRAGSSSLLAGVESDGSQALGSDGCAVRVVDSAGRAWRVTFGSPVVENDGALRVSVRLDGSARLAPGSPVLNLRARLDFFAGTPAVRCRLTAWNPRRAAHPDGFWELGDAGSLFVRELALTLSSAASDPKGPLSCSLAGDQPLRAYPSPLEIYQESSGGPNWNSLNHINREGRVPMQLPGFEVRCGDSVQTGSRATPLVLLGSQAEPRVAVAFRRFWEEFPKAVAVDGRSVTVAFLPARFPDVHEIQGGEQKTHECWLGFGPAVANQPLAWCRTPVFVRATPDWYCASGVVPYLTPEAADPNCAYVALVRSAIEGKDSLARKREVIDEYGWRHFGDLYADHEGIGLKAATPVVSHYNNQYDAVWGMLCQFLRSGDPRWHQSADELARHVADIDIYHTDDDKAAYNHGLFWHTAHYTDGGKSSHRSYPRARGVPGGGPSNEHNYSTGLLLHYYLTGDLASREAVLELAEWTVAMEDGSRTPFRWLAQGSTGLSSQTGSTDYHGPGRGPANCIDTLLNAHRLTREDRWLAQAEMLLRRCIHPADDIEARNLLDAERRWSYTVFLQALGRYLDYKAEQRAYDETYSWAQRSLVHYARWMATHEYPYLDKPEILEYPNETWPAQDMRKALVLGRAALCLPPAERGPLLDRGCSFFEYSVRTLTAMPTHVLTRPTVLMLGNGWAHWWFAENAPSTPGDRPGAELKSRPPQPFVPQKTLALVRAKVLVAAAGAALLALAATAAVVLL